MAKEIQVIALGELLMDMTPNRQGLFQANPGGAPANVLVQLSKLGISTSFIGKVGADDFGRKLKETLISNSVDCRALVMDPQKPTTLAFVHLTEDGDRSFSFYRKNCADTGLTIQEIPEPLIEQAEIAHFGSLSLTDEPSRSATFHFLKLAQKNKLTICYDPNLRELLWESLDEAKEFILKGLEYPHIVKLSEEELLLLSGPEAIEAGAAELMEKFPQIKLLLVTRGPEGSDLFWKGGHLYQEALKVSVRDTTGAGDSFLAGFLFGILSSGKTIENIKDWKPIFEFANKTASLVITRKGAIPAMGDLREIKEF